MKSAKLIWDKRSDYYIFSVSNSDRKVPVSQWALHDIFTDYGSGSISTLLSYEDNSSVIADEYSIKVPETIIAQSDSVQALQLGLPPVLPYRIQIKGNGAIVSPQFKPSYIWLDKNARPLMGVKRDGALLNIARQSYLLTEPVYSLVCLLDKFITTPFADNDQKMLMWGEIQRFFPADAHRQDL